MPIFIWVVAVIAAIGFIACIIWFVKSINPDFEGDFMPRGGHIASSIIVALIAIAIAVGSLFWLYGTAPGQRELKSFASETGGGLTRVVTVYDLQGDVIDTYEGTFDIQTDSTKVFFDMPQGDGTTKRVQIFNATVVVEEK